MWKNGKKSIETHMHKRAIYIYIERERNACRKLNALISNNQKKFQVKRFERMKRKFVIGQQMEKEAPI